MKKYKISVQALYFPTLKFTILTQNLLMNKAFIRDTGKEIDKNDYITVTDEEWYNPAYNRIVHYITIPGNEYHIMSKDKNKHIKTRNKYLEGKSTVCPECGKSRVLWPLDTKTALGRHYTGFVWICMNCGKVEEHILVNGEEIPILP